MAQRRRQLWRSIQMSVRLAVCRVTGAAGPGQAAEQRVAAGLRALGPLQVDRPSPGLPARPLRPHVEERCVPRRCTAGTPTSAGGAVIFISGR